MDDSDWLAQRFEQDRARLTAIARRMLGSAADADDAVQEAWLRLSRSDADSIENLGSWLTTVLSRVCLNILQARRARAEAPLELDGISVPADGVPQSDPMHEVVLADSVGLALMIMLDTLSPPERVAFVLHDVFGVPFEEVATIVGRKAAATRKLASRARQRIRTQDTDRATGSVRQAKLVEAFLAAARNGEFEQLVAVLDPDVVLRADPVAVRLGAPPQARGAVAVAEFCQHARGAVPALLNGAAAVAWMPGGKLRVVFEFTTTHNKITAINLVADPARLSQRDLIAPLEQSPYPHAADS
jgi:RNA polymerase sigma factor (sigma-70 family)